MEDENMIEIPIRIRHEVLVSYARSIKKECLENKTCEKCIFYNKTGEAPVCALIVTPPEYWNLSQIKEEGDKNG